MMCHLSHLNFRNLQYTRPDKTVQIPEREKRLFCQNRPINAYSYLHQTFAVKFALEIAIQQHVLLGVFDHAHAVKIFH